MREQNVEVWLLAGNTDCYVTYPRGVGANRQRTWYEARNKCLRLNGDLATIKITSANELDWLEKNVKYWIGLQRDPLMMFLPGTSTNDRLFYVVYYLLIFVLISATSSDKQLLFY